MKRSLIFCLVVVSISVDAQIDSKKHPSIFLEFPYINNIIFNSNNSISSKWGFLGIGFGADFGDEMTAYGIKIGACTSMPAPIGPISLEYGYIRLDCIYVNVFRKHIYQLTVFPRLDDYYKFIEIGYGLNYNRFSRRPFINNPENKISHSMGFSAFSNFALYRGSYIGLQYHPSIINFSDSDILKYQHLISIVFGVRKF